MGLSIFFIKQVDFLIKLYFWINLVCTIKNILQLALRTHRITKTEKDNEPLCAISDNILKEITKLDNMLEL